MSKEELARYLYRIQKAAAANSSDLLANEGPDHARVLLTSLFGSAKSHIRLFTGHFDHGVYNDTDMGEKIRAFLSDGTRTMEVLIECPGAVVDSASKALLETFDSNENFKIYTLSPEAAAGYDFHFAAIDDRGFRFEQDTEGYAAFGSFNRPEFAKQLVQLFDTLKSRPDTKVGVHV